MKSTQHRNLIEMITKGYLWNVISVRWMLRSKLQQIVNWINKALSIKWLNLPHCFSYTQNEMNSFCLKYLVKSMFINFVAMRLIIILLWKTQFFSPFTFYSQTMVLSRFIELKIFSIINFIFRISPIIPENAVKYFD